MTPGANALQEPEDVATRLHGGLLARLQAGDRDAAIDFAARLRRYLDERAPGDSADRAAWFLLTLAAQALMYESKLQALTDLYKAVRSAATAGREDLAARAFERIAVIHASQGRLRDARQVIDQERERRSGVSLFLCLAHALCAVEQLDEEAATLIAAPELDEVPDPYWALLLLGRARWAMARGGATVALETAAIGRTSKRTRPRSLSDSVLHAIRTSALTAMGDPTTALDEQAGATLFLTPELELARARADIAARSMRSLGVIRRLSVSEDAGPSIRAEAMLLSLQVDPGNQITVHAVRALVELEGIRRVITTAPPSTADTVWPERPVALPVPEARVPAERLRDSELRVLELLAEPGEMTDIAERLNVTKNTLKTHVRAVYRKLGVASRDAAVAQAYLRGLLISDADTH